MKVFTPEISWHQKEPIFSVDFCPGTWKLASAGADFTIKIWLVKEDAEENAGLDFLANLDRHSKPVNCVRFSPDGKYLASAGDDCVIILWKLSEDADDMFAEPSLGSEDVVNKEKWVVHKMLRRGHLEDIYDLAWSPDGKQLISGSVDNSAIIWDVSKGHFTNIIKDHKHYVQGVCWDPRGQYVVTHSSDRTCRVYSLSKNRCVQTIHKSSFPVSVPTEDGKNHKTSKLFMDETMQSFFRRCQFSPDGLLLVLPVLKTAYKFADCVIILWKLSEDADDMFAEPSLGSEDVVNKEKWVVHKMLRRGHLEDIYDLAWSPDGKQLISGSVDNSAIIWDVSKGHFTNIIKDHKHYVQGVCWDPRGQYVVTHSSDRTCRVYSLSKNRCVQTIHKSSFPVSVPTEDGKNHKTSKLFMDETMQSFFRRCQFSPDGLLLVLPGGVYGAGEKPVKATYVFSRGGFNKPALCLPGSKKPSVCTCFCPVAFDNMSSDGNKENESESFFKLPYRMCYAVATLDSVVFYDTQHQYPFGFVSNVHYASLTDMTWSSDGRILVVSSLDGYCSIVSFKDGELGKPSEINPTEYVSNKLKAKREAKKKAVNIDVATKAAASVKDKEQEGGTPQRPATQSKDQPTLFQCITPARKRKRPFKSPQPLSSSPLVAVASGNGSPDAPFDLTGNDCNEQSKSAQASPLLASSVASREGTPSNDIDKKTPKRANLITLGFKRIPKPGSSSESKDETQENPENGHKPRRIHFVTLQGDMKGQPSTAENKSVNNPTPVPTEVTNESTPSEAKLISDKKETSDGACSPTPQIKPARRVALLSVPAKRDHSGGIKEGAEGSLGATNVVSDNTQKSTSSIPKSTEGETGIPTDKASKSTRRVVVVNLVDTEDKVEEKQDLCLAKAKDPVLIQLSPSGTVDQRTTLDKHNDKSEGELGAKAQGPVCISIDESGPPREDGSFQDSHHKTISDAVKETNSNVQEASVSNDNKQHEPRSITAKEANSSPGGKAPRRVEFMTLKKM
ncbi:chromatin assembly factor 1 subunit B-like [Rhopilema esculentum]|uniref:chromatin assembly factor 1 subunit B-like n=1 Tax=Rhopilema esculentum TaxID=499914 RepID=UPI0031E4645C